MVKSATLRRALLCLSIGMFAPSTTWAQTSAAPGDAHVQADTTMDTSAVKVRKGIVYTNGKHGPLVADLYLPPQEGKHSAILYLHGGGWKSGDRTQLAAFAKALATDGYAGVAIEYDLTVTGDHFPTALSEAHEALQWIRSHSSEYHFDPSRIAVVGSSAGGELAALLGENPASSVQAVVVMNGVLDLRYVGPEGDSMVVPYLGETCSQAKWLCEEASPTDHVHPGMPPFYVGHGTKDVTVPYSQATAFIAKLQAANVVTEVFRAEGAGHTYWNAPEWKNKNMIAVRQFLDLNLLKRRRHRDFKSSLPRDM